MSKKESEFDRYERMRKLEREAEVERRKSIEPVGGKTKRGGRPKQVFAGNNKNLSRTYELALEDDDY